MRINCAKGVLCCCSLLLSACSGPQSTLSPSGLEAEQIARLFWCMTAGTVVVWCGVLGIAWSAIRASPGPGRRRQAERLVFAGALVPTLVLFALLIYGLSILPAMIAPAPADTLRISVYGERWWWRVRYEPPGEQPFEIANEIRLPVGRPVEFLLHSNNVIHSFWIPSLGGKMDMIPGRVNRLVLHPTRTGRFRGVCAEFCGAGHARMAFEAVVMGAEDFQRWFRSQAANAASPPVTEEPVAR